MYTLDWTGRTTSEGQSCMYMDDSSFDGKCQTVAYNGTLLVDDVADDNLLGDLFDDSARENGNYWVLDTDYTSFAIVYSCTSFRGIGRTGLMPVHN